MATLCPHGSFSPKRISRIATAALGAVALLGAAAPIAPVPGPLPEGSKRVFNFNVVGCPDGQSHNRKTVDGGWVLVDRDASGARVRVERSAQSWGVSDGDATSNHPATLAAAKPGIYDVYMRILSDPSADGCACAATMTDTLSGETLCLVGTIDLTGRRGQSMLELAPAAMFDASLQERTWSMNFNADLRIAQFRVYSRG